MKLIGKITILFLLLFLLLPAVVSAQGDSKPILPPGNDPSGWGWGELTATVGNVANLLLALVVGVAIIFIIIGGYKYIFAFGDPEAIQQAKGTITWAILGLILALMAVMIIRYIEVAVPRDAPSPDFPGDTPSSEGGTPDDSGEGEGNEGGG